MARIDTYKDNLAQGEKTFLAEFESSIKEFITNLKTDNLLNQNFTKDNVSRIKKFVTSSNAAAHLEANANKIITLNQEETDKNIQKLKEMGLRIDTIADQYGTIMCHMYQVTAERLKLHLVTLINFSLLNLPDAHKQPLGCIISKLKVKYPTNKFIQYLDTKIRNAVTHYTYYFGNGKLNLCNGYFDSSPREMEIKDFMIESKRLNILTESFLIIFLDKHNPNGSLILDKS